MEDTDRDKVRDHLANERTFLAWVRSSVAIMAFGFVVVKFSLFLKQLSLLLGAKAGYRGLSPIIGVGLVITGAIILTLAYFRFKRVEAWLDSASPSPRSTLIPFLSVAILLFALLLIAYLVMNIMLI